MPYKDADKRKQYIAEWNRQHRAEWYNSTRNERNAKRREYSKHNGQKIKAQRALWKQNEPEKYRALRARGEAQKRSTARGRLNDAMRGGVSQSLASGAKNNRRWESLVGFTIDQLRRHLEKQFTPGMTWENYGTEWHVDHKIPIAVFNFDRPEDIDFRICWSLKNLQPLNATENMKKRAKIEAPFQPALKLCL